MTDLSRRSVLLAAAAAVTALAGCGDSGGSSDARPASPTPAPTTGAAFPVTVEHAFGSTTVPARPVRVVSVGYTEQDTLLALGVTPVAVTEWYGDQPFATWPWARAALGDATPTVLSIGDSFQFERIASLRPDLIVGTNAGMKAGDYARLSRIAPTIAHSGATTATFEPWDVQTQLIADALGEGDRGRALVADLKRQFADVATAHPEWAGMPAIFLQNAFYEGDAIAYQNGLSTDFLTDLGFTVPRSLDAFAQGEGQAYVPLERLGVLNDAKVLIWATEQDSDRAALEAQPLYRALTPVRAGNQVFTGGTLAGAIYFTSPLSLPYVLQQLVPQLERAVAGDPALAPRV